LITQDRQTQRRIVAAHIPPRLRGLSLMDGEQRRLTGLITHPPDRISTWCSDVLSGAVVAAERHFLTCGKGLWATGHRPEAYLTSVMRDLMVQGPFTGLYLPVDAYLDSHRPDGDHRFDIKVAEVSMVVLAIAGTESMTEWTRSTLRSLFIKRFDAGLPTLVAASVEPSEYLADTLAGDIFYRVGIMEEDSDD
jgi:hypothetical protein